MIEMNMIRRGAAVTGAAGLLSLGLATVALADPPDGSDANHPESWEEYLRDKGFVDVECAKVDEDLDSPSWVSDDDYLLVVLKYSTISEQFWYVEVDEELTTETEQDISHVIACYGEKPRQTPSATPSHTKTPKPTATMTSPQPTSTRPAGPVVETDVPAKAGNSLPVVLGGVALLAGAGLAAGLRRARGQH